MKKNFLDTDLNVTDANCSFLWMTSEISYDSITFLRQGTLWKVLKLTRFNPYKPNKIRKKSLHKEFSAKNNFPHIKSLQSPVWPVPWAHVLLSLACWDIKCSARVAAMYTLRFLFSFFSFFTCITFPSEPTEATMPWRAAKQSIVDEPWKQRISQKGNSPWDWILWLSTSCGHKWSRWC